MQFTSAFSRKHLFSHVFRDSSLLHQNLRQLSGHNSVFNTTRSRITKSGIFCVSTANLHLCPQLNSVANPIIHVSITRPGSIFSGHSDDLQFFFLPVAFSLSLRKNESSCGGQRTSPQFFSHIKKLWVLPSIVLHLLSHKLQTRGRAASVYCLRLHLHQLAHRVQIAKEFCKLSSNQFCAILLGFAKQLVYLKLILESEAEFDIVFL